ncbi:hypothetical protein FVE85_3370 [Porphyridium purpureum]|uniref:F-box domain-containing protein n=1 Tax=Porphyridium purpureum TaxID=35688 RepID=A0A5J4YUF0_PORPP|nr:hypothetical protein FVE85_3370 [Porphyridium purpureum]|eukprot:POR5596..scf227_4
MATDEERGIAKLGGFGLAQLIPEDVLLLIIENCCDDVYTLMELGRVCSHWRATARKSTVCHEHLWKRAFRLRYEKRLQNFYAQFGSLELLQNYYKDTLLAWGSFPKASQTTIRASKKLAAKNEYCRLDTARGMKSKPLRLKSRWSACDSRELGAPANHAIEIQFRTSLPPRSWREALLWMETAELRRPYISVPELCRHEWFFSSFQVKSLLEESLPDELNEVPISDGEFCVDDTGNLMFSNSFHPESLPCSISNTFRGQAIRVGPYPPLLVERCVEDGGWLLSNAHVTFRSLQKQSFRLSISKLEQVVHLSAEMDPRKVSRALLQANGDVENAVDLLVNCPEAIEDGTRQDNTVSLEWFVAFTLGMAKPSKSHVSVAQRDLDY